MAGFQILDTIVREHRYQVALDHSDPKSTKIQLFARELTNRKHEENKSPYLLYLNGGPGFECLRPTDGADYLAPVMEEYRIVLLDQRGTGQSQAFDLNCLDQFADAEAIADYLSCFRADAIVRDAELLREKLGIDRWALLGQSYGGFCCFTYLSHFPGSIERVLITGGMPPIGKSALEVYQATHARMLSKNSRYFNRFPEDQVLCQKVLERITAKQAVLPSGIPLSAARFQQLGIVLGRGTGDLQLHYLLEKAFAGGGDGGQLSYSFLRSVESLTSTFETNSLYALLHESIYCEGEASRWAAARAKKNFPAFKADSKSFHFTGEMVYPSFFTDYKELKKVEEAANILAEKDDWPQLYQVEKISGASCRVAALIYDDDAFVEKEFSIETAKLLPDCNVWLTNEYEHDGLRQAPKRIIERLLQLSS